MGEASADGGTMGEIDHLSPHNSGRPRDLLRQFSGEIHDHHQCRTEESDDIELSLGLSLGGRFGVDPIQKTRLVRSSSTAAFARIQSYEDLGTSGIPVSPVITRTVSLPTETEEDRRKRKEIQCLRRMEAKRKRTEKQKNLSYRSAGKDEDKRGEEEGIVGIPLKGKAIPVNGFSPSVSSAYGIAAGWGSGSARGTAAVDPMSGKSGVLTASVGLMGFVPSSQGSLGSQGSSSSGVTDFESRVNQGLNANEARSPTSVQSLPERAYRKLAGSGTEKPAKPVKEEAVHNMSKCTPGLKKPKVEVKGVVREMGKNVMEEMPCVTTRGCGPNGRKVEGFLYRYRKGEEVRIVCVCHGNFLSPAEFVKHAGGGDVQYPLKHIVVSPSSSFL
ncbi:ninja-family protein AFP3-like [Aristolochia californica]|uniref:ninja-family protein AFP3-like n=1 Tax=Aristolochia californica TaxID=171875 RepID=UPI0035E17481